MTIPFDETNVNRAKTGTFDTKTQGGPEVGFRSQPQAATASDIAGYTWRAEIFTGPNLVEAMVSAGELSPAARDMDVEEVLEQHAGASGISREDEFSFDSSDFPKVISRDQVTIDDHPALGLTYFDFPGFDEAPRNASDALDAWADTLDMQTDSLDNLWNGTDYSKPAEWNLAVLAENATTLGIDFDALGYPLPTQHN